MERCGILWVKNKRGEHGRKSRHHKGLEKRGKHRDINVLLTMGINGLYGNKGARQ